MVQKVELTTPQGTMMPVGPYSHIAKSGDLIIIGAVAGLDPVTGELAGPDVTSQTKQILDAFDVMLGSVGSDLAHILHITVFLKNMDDFEAMNIAYESKMSGLKPARTAISVTDLPKPGALLTMSLTAVTNG